MANGIAIGGSLRGVTVMAVTFKAVSFEASQLVASPLDRHLAGAFMKRPAIRPGQLHARKLM